MGLNKRGRKEDGGESSSSNYSSSDDDENADENNKTTTNVEEFGFERVEKLTGRRLKQEKLNKKKQKSGGFESMDLPPDIFRAIKRKGYRLPTPIFLLFLIRHETREFLASQNHLFFFCFV